MPDPPLPSAGLKPAPIIAALAPAGLIVFLGLQGGGFDQVLYASVGVGVWTVLLIGAAAGVIRVSDLTRPGLIVVALLAAFAAWTGLSMIWSESAGRGAEEMVRALTYLGVLGLFAAAQRPGTRRITLASVAVGIAVIVGVALLSRMQPLWFPKNETLDLVFASEARLNYPLNYWNGLAGLIAIGVPLVAFYAAHARSLGMRMLATAGLPALGLALYLTISRGGALALGLALLALVILDHHRLRLLSSLAVGAAGTFLLILAAEARPGFIDGLRAGDALTQGDEMMLLTLATCAGAGALAWLTQRAGFGDRRRTRVAISSRTRVRAALAGVAVVAVVAVAIDAPGRIDNTWQQFKDPGVERDSARLSSASGNGRYQWWDAARRANASAPLIGIGAGTFQFWWAREGTIASQVVDAHSLYLETLGELGLVGFLLIVGFVGGTLVLMVRFTRASHGENRELGAAATAAAVAFAAAAATDWAWELPVLPVAFLIVVAAVLGAGSERRPATARSRAGLAAFAAGAVLLIIPPLLGTRAVRNSQDDAAAGRLTEALSSAERGRSLQPYAGSAALQEALVLELIGGDRLGPAAEAARDATEKEPTNWENWLVLSRIEYERGRAGPSIAAFREARSLNPNSLLFEESAEGDAG